MICITSSSLTKNIILHFRPTNCFLALIVGYRDAKNAKEYLSSIGYKVGFANVKIERSQDANFNIRPAADKNVFNLNWLSQDLPVETNSWEHYTFAKEADSMFAVGGPFNDCNSEIG